MITTITKSDFTASFHRMGRGNQFSHKGLLALYDYLEELGEATGQQVELDVIALCCEYAEYDSLEEFQNDYGEDYQTMEDIEYQTTVIKNDTTDIKDTSFIIRQF